MKFKISRTSSWNDKPCVEAKKMQFERWHTRTCSEDEYNRKFSANEGKWMSRGKNHFITEKGYVCRQEEDTSDWGIEINSLDDLLKLQKKYGNLIIQEYYSSNPKSINQLEIEIYDDYRE